MWEHGTFTLDGIEFIYDAKVFEEGSPFGIDNGRISKLSIWKGIPEHLRSMNNLIVHYDRGWDVLPCNKLDREALYYVLLLYPTNQGG